MAPKSSTTPSLPFEKGDSWGMFNQIARRYDLLNKVLSLGIDRAWRTQVARQVPLREGTKVLDVATGTADLLVEVLRRRRNISRAVGVDKAEGMLAVGERKLAKNGLVGVASLQAGDAENLPFGARSFDVATIGFGVRNLPDPQKALKECHRTLKPKGRLIVLEFSIPNSSWVRVPYMAYLEHVLPRLGGLVSGNPEGYSYLAQTIQTFPYGGDFLDWMRAAGFSNCSCRPMTFGIVSLYVGQKK